MAAEERPRLRAVVFDADGTLLDSLGPHVAFCRRMSERHTGGAVAVPDPADLEACRALSAAPMDNFLRRAGFDEALVPMLVEEYERSFAADFPVKPFDAAALTALLDACGAAGVPTGVVTSNTAHNTRACLGKDLADRFSFIWGIDNGPRSKLDGMRAALRYLGASRAPEEVLYVGDTRKDGACAAEAGMSFLPASYGFEDLASDAKVTAAPRALPVAMSFEEMASTVQRRVEAACSAPARVLVLGAAGYVGQFVVQRLLEHTRVEVHGTCHRTALEVSGLICHPLDLADTSPQACEGLLQLLKRVRPNVVVNAVALSSLRACEENATLAAAVNTPVHLLDALGALDSAPFIVHFSTDLVYKRPPASAPPGVGDAGAEEPTSVYARTKLAFDAALAERAAASDEGRVDYVVLRSSNIVGPVAPFAPTPTKFLQWVEGRFEAREHTTFFNDEVRSCVAVADVARVVEHFVLDAAGLSRVWPDRITPAAPPAPVPASRQTLYDMGGPEPLTRLDVANAVADALQVPDEVRSEVVGSVSRESVDLGYKTPADVRLDSSALEAEIGWRFMSLRDMLRTATSDV